MRGLGFFCWLILYLSLPALYLALGPSAKAIPGWRLKSFGAAESRVVCDCVVSSRALLGDYRLAAHGI
jgi:hypothetical protein